jgi:hypothetical protein
MRRPPRITLGKDNPCRAGWDAQLRLLLVDALQTFRASLRHGESSIGETRPQWPRQSETRMERPRFVVDDDL